MKVLIAAPLKQKPHIFDEFQKSLDNLIIPAGVTIERFFVVNDCPEIVEHIKGEYITVDMGGDYEDHVWRDNDLHRMEKLRNITIAAALNSGADYLFSVDTDLVLHPETLVWLLKAEKDLVSEIFWTLDWCNAWMYDAYSPPMEEWKTPGLYQVGMTGACFLISRRAMMAGCDYTFIPNIRRAFWGEDRHFCVRAACLGFDLWVDTHVPATHLYTEKEYQKFVSGRQ